MQASFLFLGLLLLSSFIQGRLIIPSQRYETFQTENSSIPANTGRLDTRLLGSAPHTGHEPQVSLRLYGSTLLGYYYITLFFGTPLQRQNLIVDTGSTITTIPCTGCGSSCGTNHMNSQFNPDQSPSHQGFTCREKFANYMCSDCQTQCHFQISYTEGSSYEGNFIKDYVVFGDDIEDDYFKKLNGESSLRPQTSDSASSEGGNTIESLIDRRKILMPFGCTSKETNLFYSQEADGILGLGVHTNNERIPPNVVDVFGMSKEDAINAFSICYASEGGLFTIGGYNTSHHDPSETIKYIPFHSESGQYRVHLDKIEFNGKELSLTKGDLNSGQGAFFDSGTTLAYAPKATVQALRASLDDYCVQSSDRCGGNKKNSGCWHYNPDEYPDIQDFYATFGVFSFYFGEGQSQKYEWKAQDYLSQDTEGSLWFCIGLDVYEGRTILGGTFMKNHDVLFDKDEKRLGFIRANCTTEAPAWVGTTTKPTDDVLFDNLKALGVIILSALIIYGLLRLNRMSPRADTRVPDTESESAAPAGQKEGDPNFRHQQMVEMVEESSVPRIDESEEGVEI